MNQQPYCIFHKKLPTSPVSAPGSALERGLARWQSKRRGAAVLVSLVDASGKDGSYDVLFERRACSLTTQPGKNDIKAAMSGMLAPDIKEVYLGQADVQQTFTVPKVGTIAGCIEEKFLSEQVAMHQAMRAVRGGSSASNAAKKGTDERTRKFFLVQSLWDSMMAGQALKWRK